MSCHPTVPSTPHGRRQRGGALALALLAAASPAFAQAPPEDAVAELRRELDALKSEQAERDLKIQRLEAALVRLEGGAAAATPAVAVQGAAAPAPAAAPAAIPATGESRLRISGDLRVRGQADTSDRDGRDRYSTQLRGRIGATYEVNDRILAGARLATGDADDPNSTDVQLSNWLDDLDVSLDQAYLRFRYDGLDLYAGKMPQPFARTELVWDGDVNPQGLGATYRRPLGGGGAFRANGLLFVVDERAAGSDSTMLGAQLGYDSAALGPWRFDVSGAYYHYALGSIAGADAGDLRSNLLAPDGSYLSDFHLANALVGATYGGFGDRWPLRIVGDYVKNLGAQTPADTGYGIDLMLGRSGQPGDWRITYGHAMAQTDAVLAAFSHDNIGIGTNYRMHALTVDYVPMPRTMLSAIWYRYRPEDPLHAGGNDPNDWLNRFRLAFLVSF